MDLRHLTDETLHRDTKYFAKQEREMTTKVLHHLKELGIRKYFSDLGYSSLFDYAVKELGYAEASASRRIAASRLLAELPEIENKIETGSLTITNIGQANTFFNQNDVTEPEKKKAVLDQLEGKTKKDAEKILIGLSGKKPDPRDMQRPLADDKTRMSITLSKETMGKINRLKNLLGKNPTMDELISFMTDEVIILTEKKKFKVSPKDRNQKKEPQSHQENEELVTPKEEVKNPTQELSSQILSSNQEDGFFEDENSLEGKEESLPPAEDNNDSTQKPSRYILSSVKREVYLRDKVCTQCGSEHNLQFEHVLPYSMGGKNDADNLKLLCFHCNQRSRIKMKL